MAAHGMTSADIGIKLGIAERTANFHFSNILSKLDALNRHEAIAKGMNLGLIRMEL
jgi:DNA-binding CsgD family transcriptional regulator